VIHFLKILMMVGGLLQITALGADAISLDERLSKSRVAVANVTLAR
jgi:uncharacterized membrane protein YphA (DoxX/SURF4 family)